jgi:tyrosinase
MNANGNDHRDSRRKFLTHGAAALAAGAALPALPALARGLDGEGPSYAPNPWRPLAGLPERQSINGGYDTAVAASMRAAVREMMALDPNDPRNWYRQAVVHVLDCPHGNAWFFPWHRGYLYWFECIARKLTGNPNFAVPYWDVTKSAIMPSFFFRGDLLDTSAKGYVHDLAEFRALLHEPLRKYWTTLSPRQLEQLKRRNWNTFDQFWSALPLSL